MSILYLLTSLLFFVWILQNILFWVSLWQTKEYRLDRLLAHLKETSQGRILLLSPLNFIKWIGIFVYPYIILYENILPLYAMIVFCIYIYEFARFLEAIFRRRLKRPVLTGKAILLLILTGGLLFVLYSFAIIQQGFLWLLILDKLTPFFIAFFVFSLTIPTMLYQDYIIDKATRKIRTFPDITVIGITGSYGKSSTKEYVSQILAKKFSVVKTKGTNNTPIGIANTILSKINNKTEIFVAEMGAYKKGEIRELCNIASPRIGILTAVAMQHLSLFGSKENLAQAKYELIEALPDNGLALFNANNTGSYALYKKTHKKKISYGLHQSEDNTKQMIDIMATAVKVEKESVQFTVHLSKKKISFTMPLIGKHTIDNVLPGIFIADYLGMTEKEIKDVVRLLQPLPKTMILHKSIHEVNLIDDTFNVNPDGVIAAMEYTEIYKGKRILVLEPMIELGECGKEEHRRVGRAIAHIATTVFLTKQNYIAEIKKGILEEKGACVVRVANAKEIAEYINSSLKKSDIVVFEGKEAAVSMNKTV